MKKSYDKRDKYIVCRRQIRRKGKGKKKKKSTHASMHINFCKKIMTPMFVTCHDLTRHQATKQKKSKLEREKKRER